MRGACVVPRAWYKTLPFKKTIIFPSLEITAVEKLRRKYTSSAVAGAIILRFFLTGVVQKQCLRRAEKVFEQSLFYIFRVLHEVKKPMLGADAADLLHVQ